MLCRRRRRLFMLFLCPGQIEGSEDLNLREKRGAAGTGTLVLSLKIDQNMLVLMRYVGIRISVPEVAYGLNRYARMP